MAADTSKSTVDTSACPIDHKSRTAWLDQAGSAPSGKLDAVEKPTASAQRRRSPFLSILPFTSSSSTANNISAAPLSSEREISSIPRASPAPSSTSTSIAADASSSTHAAASACPANHESETGTDASSGRWVYPSEAQFFAALQRKQRVARAEDMRSVVPIHNAVNERAWGEILAWERGRGAESCGGPRLHSFRGDANSPTPRARWNSLLGYASPFDRHDWIVDRCGQRVEYVIDFYAGKGGGLNFYLDVRPKLNSWEGVRMRVERAVGW